MTLGQIFIFASIAAVILTGIFLSGKTQPITVMASIFISNFVGFSTFSLVLAIFLKKI